MESKKATKKEIKDFISSFIGEPMTKYLEAKDIIEARKIMSNILLTEKNGGNFMDALIRGVQDEVIRDVELFNEEGFLIFIIRQDVEPYFIEGYMSDTTRYSEVKITGTGVI